MKLVRLIKETFMNRDLSLQDRMFRLFATLALTGFGIGILGGITVGADKANLIFVVLVFFLLLGLALWSVHFRKIQIGAVIIATIMVFALLPVNFLTSGGVYSGSPIGFILGVVYICLNVSGKIKYFFLGSLGVVVCGCYFIAYFYPDMIIEYSRDMTFSDSLLTSFVVSASIAVMILFQNAIYQSENRFAKEQTKEVEELNKSQNRFFSTMSHEIRTPINTIIGLNEMILREDISDEVAADAKNIQGASKMLLTLINDILDMSKIESGSMDIVPVDYDLGAMLSDIVNMIWVKAKEKGLEFHVNVDEKTPSKLYGDEVRIKQILINVLNNAVKYTSEGSVTLSIQCGKAQDGTINMIYSIADTGMGIKKESLPHLFSAFKRVDEEKNRYIEGTGLGLSIVKQLAELMNGSITVNSIYTKGSTFIITLPQGVSGETHIGKLDLEAKHDISRREHYRQSFEAPDANVLIVDDNEMNLMVAEKLLRDTFVKVKTVTSGAACLRETARAKYDVIFMDHMMPEMDGIECFHAIRKQAESLNADTPIVILTANAGGENRALYEREGFNGYLLKPISGKQLEMELLRQLPRELVKIIRDEENDDTSEVLFVHRSKIPIIITMDSVCDLPSDLTEKHKIAVMPYHVYTDDGDFMEGIEVETDGLMSYIECAGKSARSEPPKVSEYEDFFEDNLTRAQHVIHITMAKNSSHGYANACEAAETFDNVQVIDSGQLSSGLGLIVLRTAEYAAEGNHTPDEVAGFAKSLKKRADTTFMLETTEYLARSGRLSPRVSKMCRALMIYPKLSMKHSKITLAGVLFGSKYHRRKKYIDDALKNKRTIDKRLLFITHVGLTHEELQEIEKEALRIVPFENVTYYQATSAIATNCGRECFGLLFMRGGGLRVEGNGGLCMATKTEFVVADPFIWLARG
ncbi:MAG: DegV family EDD domain-containing protein, partial [Lachnospiraceae bacterium]|nr:DegV family EDD domain-containing protein [Lachnospiraceae bacterium]